MQLEVSFDERAVAEAREFRDGQIDMHFDLEGEMQAHLVNREAGKERTVRFSRRLIDEEAFQNVTFEECCQQLATEPIGSFMFRPSSKGPEHLSLTIRFPGNAFGHYDIIERGKRGENDLALGRELSIEGVTYDSLDEVRWRFATPIGKMLETIVAHHTWIADKKTARQFVEEAVRDNPGMLNYRLTVDPAVPNCIIFVWVGHGRLWEEPIRLRPDDVMWRHASFKSIWEVISQWKLNGYKQEPSTNPRPIESRRTEREERLEAEAAKIGPWGRTDRRATDPYGRASYAGYVPR
jgi:transcription elongation factor SPT6